jgi:hypothetical protein
VGAAIARIEKKLGPATYMWRPAPGADPTIDHGLYWSVPAADGSCEQLWLQRAGTDSPFHPNVLDLGVKSIPAGEALEGDLNAPNPCTGGPKNWIRARGGSARGRVRSHRPRRRANKGAGRAAGRRAARNRHAVTSPG